MPLVYIEKKLDSVSHVAKPEGPFAPINQFAHYREFPDASNRTVVGLNVDTLYSLAGLDLAQEPMVLSIPEMGGRYWLMQLIDAWILLECASRWGALRVEDQSLLDDFVGLRELRPFPVTR